MAKVNIKLNIRSYLNKLSREMRKRMAKIANLIEGKVKNSMVISNLGGSNPSKPGSAPHVGSGDLKRSIKATVEVRGQEVVVKYGAMEGPGADYARRLELGFSGTDSQGRNYNQQPRPFLKPALVLNKETIKKYILKG